MKLYISPYQLAIKNSKRKPLRGALLAFDFGSERTGYSDFLPWPDFGEPTLAQQLKQIQGGVESLRFQIARQNAFLDAQARSEKRNLFFGLKIPESHFLIEDLLSFSKERDIDDRGYRFVKVKLHPFSPTKQTEKLKHLSCALPSVKWRLDLNGNSWKSWKKRLDFLVKDLDFVEDPQEKFFTSKIEQRRFAEDWIFSPHLQIKIAKPSRDSLASLLKGMASSRWKRVIFTHSMDHPFGQVITAFWAGKFYQNQSHLFETGALKCLNLQEEGFPLHKNYGPVFDPPKGFGFGFGEILKKQSWKRWL